MTKTKSNIASENKRDKPFFVNQFVNTVYGIVLGYGFSNSMGQIEAQAESGNPGAVSTFYSLAAVLYIIIVICVYWWDWVDNVGHRAHNTAREFALDISILVSLESLFFVFEYPIFFAFLFFFLAILNLLWVYNFRFNEYNTFKSSNQVKSWSEYLGGNERARRHIRNRWYGILLFGACLLFAIQSKNYGLDIKIITSISDAASFTQACKGFWTVLLVIMCAGLFNRIVLYRDRFAPRNKNQ
jgi:magnesium-transporting ATPase (P-type)